MLENIRLEDILFLDIETVPVVPDYEFLDEDYKKLWNKKSEFIAKETESVSETFGRAGIYAEFGKIICISAGYVIFNQGVGAFKVKSFFGDDEKQLLSAFILMLNKFDRGENKLLCAHNGKEFDFPFIARRCLINGLKLPAIINIAGKKPWEIKHLDTMELWKFGDFKNYTSLELLAKVFEIPTPKDDIDGSQVAKVFYEENDLDRIVKYCEKDVLTVAQLLLKYKGMALIESENVEISG